DLALGLLTELRTRPDVAVVRSGFTDEDIERMRKFLAAWPPTTFVPRDAYSDAGIHSRLGTLLEQLASPMSPMVREGAPPDPFGGQWEPVEVLRAAKGGDALDDDGGIVVTADRAHAFLFVETKASPFDSSAQRAFRAVLDAWLARTPGARLQTAGSAQF